MPGKTGIRPMFVCLPGDKSPSGVVTAGGAKAAWFKDSEGNILAIVQSA